MARARNIKPGFFKNEELAEIEPLGRILFAGLWCLADREGRLEDRPKRIKIEILPYDDVNVDKLLNELHNKGFIIRYSVNGERYIQIVNFLKHQNPHVREAPSEIPAPPAQAQEKHSTGTVQEPEKHSTSPADSLKLKTDSLKPINTVPYRDIVDYLNQRCNKNFKHTTPSTQRYIKARWNEGHRLEAFKKVIDVKAAQWLGTEQEKYLRPETLFGTKFESYLNEKTPVPKCQPPPQTNYPYKPAINPNDPLYQELLQGGVLGGDTS